MDEYQSGTRQPVEPTKREYHLSCRVKFIKGQADVKGVKVDRTMAILIPRESDQRTYFMSAWLPDTKDEHFELIGYIPNPIDSNVRLSIHRGPDKNCHEHYLFVMTKGVEDILVGGNLNDMIYPVRIFGEDHEEEADTVRDSDQSYDLVHKS